MHSVPAETLESALHLALSKSRPSNFILREESSYLLLWLSSISISIYTYVYV